MKHFTKSLIGGIIHLLHPPLAQLDRVPDSDSVGREFESPRAGQKSTSFNRCLSIFYFFTISSFHSSLFSHEIYRSNNICKANSEKMLQLFFRWSKSNYNKMHKGSNICPGSEKISFVDYIQKIRTLACADFLTWIYLTITQFYLTNFKSTNIGEWSLSMSEYWWVTTSYTLTSKSSPRT